MSVTITFYQNTSEPIRVDKTNYLTTITTMMGNFRDSVDEISPVFLIEQSTLPEVNYCYIHNFNKYYFIDDITIVQTGLYEIKCSLDVLMTHKEDIVKLYAYVERNEYTYNENIVDDNVEFEQGYDIDEITIPNTFFTGVPLISSNDVNNVMIYGLGLSLSSSSGSYDVSFYDDRYWVRINGVITEASPITHHYNTGTISIINDFSSYSNITLYIYTESNGSYTLIGTAPYGIPFNSTYNGYRHYVISSTEITGGETNEQ